jgi:hypothetical protein
VIILLAIQIAAPAVASVFLIHPDGSGDFATIQEAIDAAFDGDTIELSDGIFVGPGNQSIDCLGKAIVIRGQNGAAATTIDGGDQGSIVTCNNGEGELTIIEGVTLANGIGTWETPPYYPDGYYGGAICCMDSSPTIRECVITGCDSDRGGGAWFHESSTMLIDCEFTDNEARYAGGAIFASGSSLTVTRCVLQDNAAFGSADSYEGGGGLYIARGTLEMTDGVISSNFAPYGGGFGTNLGAVLTFERTRITGNSATLWGGGFQATQATVFLTRCEVIGNTCAGSGGAAYFFYSSSGGNSQFADCMIVDNSAGLQGGAIRCLSDSPLVTGCTFVGNAAGNEGSGIHAQYHSSPIVENTIIANGSGNAVACWSNSTVTLTCSDLFGNTGGDWVDCIAEQEGLNGNFSSDPLFCGTPEESGPMLFAGASDITLHADSPCLPGNHPDGADCGLVGAHGVGCGVSPAPPPAMEKPAAVEETTWGRMKSIFR